MAWPEAYWRQGDGSGPTPAAMPLGKSFGLWAVHPWRQTIVPGEVSAEFFEQLEFVPLKSAQVVKGVECARLSLEGGEVSKRC